MCTSALSLARSDARLIIKCISNVQSREIRERMLTRIKFLVTMACHEIRRVKGFDRNVYFSSVPVPPLALFHARTLRRVRGNLLQY